MLHYESADQLLAESEARRYLHVVILNALRDQATRIEFRYADGGILPYYRVDGRDWELLPPPEEIGPLLMGAVREVSRLVVPERPDATVSDEAKRECGWLTYRLRGVSLDLYVRIDPPAEFGMISIDNEADADITAAAGEALAEYAARLVE